MRKRTVLFLFCAVLFPLACFSYNYGSLVDLPEGVKKMLPENPDILSSASADLNGDKFADYIVVNQYIDPESNNDEEAKKNYGEGRRYRELVVFTADKDGKYTIAARSKRAVLCSDCGAKDEDPFLAVKALTKTFTILHKFTDPTGETWGITAKFGYSRRDNKWQLVSFSGGDDKALKPDFFGLINLEDYDINHFMAERLIEAVPEQAAKTEFFADDILYTEEGTAFVIRPDGTNKRYAAGDRDYRKISQPNWTADKKEIYYVKNNDAYVMNSDGKNNRKIFRDILGASLYRYDDEGKIYRFVRSPDGKKYAVAGYPTNRDYNESNLYVMDSDGKNRKIIVKGTNYDGISSPSWSPDSSKLAYYHGVTLKVMDMNNGSVFELKYGRGSGLAWSKDGKRILTAVSGAYDIIEVETRNIKEIKCQPVTGQGVLFWSADEKSALTYTSDYGFIISLEEGAKSTIIIKPENGLIDGLYW